MEFLCDNDTVFRSRCIASFAARWSVTLRFRAAHAPSGNGIVERNHRTVKVIAARKQCSIAEAVHLYNAAPRELTIVPLAVSITIPCETACSLGATLLCRNVSLSRLRHYLRRPAESLPD